MRRNSAPERQQSQSFWLRKLLNISDNTDYSADTDSDSDEDGHGDEKESQPPIDDSPTYGSRPRIRRRVSETTRAQYINTKEIRVCVGTWNIAGKLPPDDLDIDGWLNIEEPADIYVIGFQEIIPLNAGNIFGSEDNRPVSIWENIIRETLNKVPPISKYKCYSGPPSPSRFKPLEDVPDIEDEIVPELGGENEIEPKKDNGEKNIIKDLGVELVSRDIDESMFLINKQTTGVKRMDRRLSSSGRLERNYVSMDKSKEDEFEPVATFSRQLRKTLSGTERIGLSWPERPLDLLPQHTETLNSFISAKSFKESASFRAYSSFKSCMNAEDRGHSNENFLGHSNLDSVISRSKSSYVRIVSKQMVGIFLTIWVRRSLRKHIQNLNVSTVGVGAMGYIGNKGSISVRMSIYQTLFCFVCAHLSSGEKDADWVKRNADVQEIHRRTLFGSPSEVELPRSIYDHERIIWLGDLNYRMNLSYEETRELISKRDWAKLVEYDQLIKELKKGRAFSGWSEGCLNFAPTYKYEANSDNYIGAEPKAARRTPAWCDRILYFGKEMKLLSYKRAELTFSDHRPVTAIYIVEVEVFSPRRLQRALNFTDAEIEDEQIL